MCSELLFGCSATLRAGTGLRPATEAMSRGRSSASRTAPSCRRALPMSFESRGVVGGSFTGASGVCSLLVNSRTNALHNTPLRDGHAEPKVCSELLFGCSATLRAGTGLRPATEAMSRGRSSASRTAHPSRKTRRLKSSRSRQHVVDRAGVGVLVDVIDVVGDPRQNGDDVVGGNLKLTPTHLIPGVS